MDGRNARWFWLCEDAKGNIYETAEVPAYRISMDNATRVNVDGQMSIMPIPTK